MGAVPMNFGIEDEIVGKDGKDIVWPQDSLLKNWFAINVPSEFFEKTALKPEVTEWLAANARLGWTMQIGSGWRDDGSGSSFSKNFCRVLFRANRDATLFKMFWGS